jgi:hypothetical protein
MDLKTERINEVAAKTHILHDASNSRERYHHGELRCPGYCSSSDRYVRHFFDCGAVIMLLDEAHHGSGGGYAYNQVIGILMCKNPHFRVLALTATPGSTPEALQNLINGLHISHVEIRDERSLDIVPYIHDKVSVISR